MANKTSSRSTNKPSKSIASIIQYQTKRKPNTNSPSSPTNNKRKTANNNNNNSGNGNGTTSANKKPQNHKKPRLQKTPPSEINDQQKKWCHQCRKKRGGVVECKKCHSKKYCISCINKWYPNVSEGKFAEACPVCLNNCNCKACLREFSNKDMQGYSCSEHDKVQYSRHILQQVILLVASLNDSQLMEKEIEAKVKGVSLSELQLQDAECEVDDDIYCDNCGAYFFDLFRSCTCGYDLCLICSRELRDGHLKTGGWKPHRDGSSLCPPKDTGCCDDGVLELKRIMPIDWVANMLEKAKGLYKINTSFDVSQTSCKCCMCYDNGIENASYLYSLSAKDIQPRDMQHFKLHWSKGEPIIVSDVVSTSSGLSWEPMVMWRAFRDITKSRNSSNAYELKAINCSDWSEVTVDLYNFFKGYSESRFKRKGSPLILKLEDWQPSCLSEGEWPSHFVEFIRFLPFKDYTHPKDGYVNVSTKLPKLSLKPDMGPRMDIAYRYSVTKLHYDKSDTVNVLVHTESDVLASSELNKTKKVKQERAVDSMAEGALWDIFRGQDVCKLEEFLRNHLAEFSHGDSLSVEQVVHPIHDRTFYLDMEHKRKLKEEFGVDPWTFKQKLGDAVFIPAGCPYQVKNLKSCTNVELNFVSPESLGECIRLQHEIRTLPNNHRAKQQKMNIGKMMIYALDQAVADLSGVIDSNGPINDLHDQFAEAPEILNGNDMNIDYHTNGWVCDTESDDDSHSHKTRSTRTRSLSSLEVNHTVDHQPAVIHDSGLSREAVGLWRGNDVGLEAKELLQAVEHRYPNTFHGVQIRPKPYWQSLLKGLHVVIKGFLETSVDALLEEQIHSLHEDLNDCERSGFDLSWARKRLDMVQKLKFGNDPCRQELMELEKSLEPLKERLTEAHERWKKARLDYDSTIHARNKKLEDVTHKFGAEYNDVLNGHLGFGMLP